VDLKVKPVLGEPLQSSINLPKEKSVQALNGYNILHDDGSAIPNQGTPKPRYSSHEIGDFDAPRIREFSQPRILKENESKVHGPLINK
jgi:hypothetical protein